jgi:hypothetical protein
VLGERPTFPTLAGFAADAALVVPAPRR